MIMSYIWDEKKNRALKAERGVSFEMVVQAIEDGLLLDILEHPNRTKYGRQKLYVVVLNNYAWIVPFEEGAQGKKPKTIFPSRRYTRICLGGEEL
jgi:uncharacterized DUF497 family protein